MHTISTTRSYISPQVARWRLGYIYSFYRIILPVILMTFMWLRPEIAPGRIMPNFFAYVCLAYCVIAVLGMVWLSHSIVTNSRHQFLMTVDFIWLSFAIGLSGGVVSGMGILLLIWVAACAMLLEKYLLKWVLVFAMIMLVVQESLLGFVGYPVNTLQLTFHLVAFVASALLVGSINARVHEQEDDLQQQLQSLYQWQNVHEYIIEKLSSGIMVLDKDGKTQLANYAASKMLNTEILPLIELKQLSNQLYKRWEAWRKDVVNQEESLHISDDRELLAEFHHLNMSEDMKYFVLLEEMTKYTQKAQNMKLSSLGRFTASMAHELRNPLGAISHAAQLLAESPISSDDKHLVGIIAAHTNRMNIVIKNILQLSRRRASVPTPLNIKNWMHDFLENFFIEPYQHLEIENACESADVSFDPGELIQVVTNLCENGIRHSFQATGKATLTVKSGYMEGHSYLDIIDKGHGVPEDKVEHIFEPFFTTERMGTGMGLYLAKELCESNGARIKYQRISDKTHFRILFKKQGDHE